ncbi:hypothetical protein ES703_71839 [subsurface metagenome]
MDASPQGSSLNNGAFAHTAVRANNHGAPDRCLLAYPAIFAYYYRPHYLGGRMDDNTLVTVYPVLAQTVKKVTGHFCQQKVTVQTKVFILGSHIKPVAAKLIAVDGFSPLEEEREEPRFKHIATAGGHVSQDFWFQNVGAGIYPAGRYLIGAGFFNKAAYPAVIIGFNHPEGRGVIHPFQGYGCLRPVTPMEANHGRYIKVGEDISIKHDKGAVKVFLGILYRAGGAQRTVLHAIG